MRSQVSAPCSVSEQSGLHSVCHLQQLIADKVARAHCVCQLTTAALQHPGVVNAVTHGKVTLCMANACCMLQTLRHELCTV